MRVRVRRGQHGLSLIEVTIMLLVLMLLTSVLAPSIFDFVVDAQWVKVKEDCEVLAISVARLIKDVGPNLKYTNGVYPTVKMDLMLSDGNAPQVDSVLAPEDTSGQPNIKNWFGTTTTTNTARGNVGNGDCYQQLVSNLVGVNTIYTVPTGASYGLSFGTGGWRGSYISPPCAADPWGNAYQVNTKWINTTFPQVGPPIFTTFWHCSDVFCISAGKNGVIETPFGMPFNYTRRGGDDHVTVIAPCDP